jgi:hypothetical protein
MYCRETDFEDMNWTELAKDNVQWWDLVLVICISRALVISSDVLLQARIQIWTYTKSWKGKSVISTGERLGTQSDSEFEIGKISSQRALCNIGINTEVTLILGDINMESWPSSLESLRAQTREGLCWRGPAATVNYTPVLSSESAPQNNNP